MDPVRLSVVVACRRPGPLLTTALDAVRAALEGVPSEVILAVPGDCASAPEVLARQDVTQVLAPPDALIPELWGWGLRVAHGAATAFTTAEFEVSPGWARALLSCLESGAAGAGGAIALGKRSGVVARAVYFLRYSAFLPPRGGPAADIPGDNAAYVGDALRRHAPSMTEGFWEVDFHRRIKREGATLRFAPEAAVTFRSDDALAERMRERYRHGRYSGRYRTRVLGHPWWRGVLATPLVPAVLALRVLRRARRRGLLAPALSCLPALLPLAGAWAVGEAAGAVAGRAARGSA